MSATRTFDQFAAHAVCLAATLRDLGRAAQFYSRDMSNADGGVRADHVTPTPSSRFVALCARTSDRLLTWIANTSVKLLLPSWRKLPSPFEPGMVGAVSQAIRSNSLFHNPLFNAYFFRAAKLITEHYAERPNLVLEHRVDAARRLLAGQGRLAGQNNAAFTAQVLQVLVEAKPVARIGSPRAERNLLAKGDPNVAVFAVAVMALLFAEAGKPMAIHDEDEFFRIVAALISPRLGELHDAIAHKQSERLSRVIGEIQSLY